jgi:Uma2 family endonuclease
MVSTPQPPATGSGRMPQATRPKTLYERLEALPEELTAEIIDGQLYTEPRPAPDHAIAASNLGAELIGPYSRGRGGPGGWWILVEPEVHFVRKTEVVVPDLAGWRRERVPVLPRHEHLAIAPDWICEVLSPSTRSKDREIKLPLFTRYGVPRVWLLDPQSYSLETYELVGANLALTGTFGPDSSPAAAPFEAVRFRIADLWT